MNTRVRDKDVAAPAGAYLGISSDKITEVGKQHQFLTPAQKTALTTGANADAQHFHLNSPQMVEFGQNGIVIAGQYMETNGVPSNVRGIPMANDGKLISISILMATPVAAANLRVRVYADLVILADMIVPIGNRKWFVRNLTAEFDAEQELRCKIIQGRIDKPTVLVEFRWR